MDIDVKIDVMKEKLDKAIKSKGLMDKQTIKVSQKLDILIVTRMRGILA